jgi:hypothetical protein
MRISEDIAGERRRQVDRRSVAPCVRRSRTEDRVVGGKLRRYHVTTTDERDVGGRTFVTSEA